MGCKEKQSLVVPTIPDLATFAPTLVVRCASQGTALSHLSLEVFERILRLPCVIVKAIALEL